MANRIGLDYDVGGVDVKRSTPNGNEKDKWTGLTFELTGLLCRVRLSEGLGVIL